MRNLRSPARFAALAACALAVPAAAQAGPYATADVHAKSHPASHSLFGPTSQFPCKMWQDPICGTATGKLSRNGRKLRQLSVVFEAGCTQPGVYIGQLLNMRSLNVVRSRFARTGHLEEDVGSGLTASSDITLKGRFKPKRGLASGTVRIVARIIDPSLPPATQQIDTCDSRTISWRVTRN